MEGKTRVIVCVLLVSLVLGQIQVEAKSCCPTTAARNIYDACRFTGGSREFCAKLSGCKIILGNTCPDGYKHDILKNNDASEVVKEAIEKYTKAGFAICTKGSITATPIEIPMKE
ncbi:hypothetical protein F8388_014367 [Cannabis sativa]|uniref:Acidic protein n=1 Tax=Cannabis sativa TaxID=3483 RepID=A0A7J6EJS4_CANSA|nr:hypothetical protein F8388_014367 [Cannabis sativa]